MDICRLAWQVAAEDGAAENTTYEAEFIMLSLSSQTYHTTLNATYSLFARMLGDNDMLALEALLDLFTCHIQDPILWLG
jgi:hypothetical protein